MRNFWIALLTGAVMCFGGSLTAAAENSVVLLDDADLLTDAEYIDAVVQLQSTANEIGMDIGVIIASPDMPKGTETEAPPILYEQHFGDTDGVFCYLDTREENPQHTLYTNGSARLYYTNVPQDDRIAVIFDEMESFLYPPADMEGALNMLSIDLAYYKNYGMSEDVYVYDESSGVYQYVVDGELLSADTPPESLSPAIFEEVSASDSDDEAAHEETTKSVNTGNASIYDEAGRLDSDEYDKCLQELQNAANYTGMNVAMVLGGQRRSEYTIESLADASYDELFGHGTDGLLYYMDLSGADSPYDYISTCGMGQMYYTNDTKSDRINAIFDEVFPYLYPAGSEDVVGAVEEFANQVIYYYDQGIPENYYVYDDVYDEYYYVNEGSLQTSKSKPYIDFGNVVVVGFGGLVVGALAALITFFAVKSHYKFKVALSPTAYVNRKNLVFHNQYDRFVRAHTTKTRIDSGGGGGGSRGGGGGRSSGGHGGGGRHR